ncbi:MAG: hypothetical protein JO362_14360 [Streptomycetaceae bacterium]|nr:hypothetical protein [Streptomycetaceae bacterium]
MQPKRADAPRPRSAPYEALVPVIDTVLAKAGHPRVLYDQHGTARVPASAWNAVLTVAHQPTPDSPADTDALNAKVRLYYATLSAHPLLAQMQTALKPGPTPNVGLTGWPTDPQPAGQTR